MNRRSCTMKSAPWRNSTQAPTEFDRLGSVLERVSNDRIRVGHEVIENVNLIAVINVQIAANARLIRQAKAFRRLVVVCQSRTNVDLSLNGIKLFGIGDRF